MVKSVGNFLLLISIVLLVSIGYSEDKTKDIGDNAPDFTLSDVYGKKVVLNKYFPENVVVLWFTNLCSGCQELMPKFEKFNQDYKNKQIKFIAVNLLGNDISTPRKLAKKLKITYPILMDPDGRISKLYTGGYTMGTCPMKSCFFIKRDRKINFSKHPANMSEEELKQQIEKLVGPHK